MSDRALQNDDLPETDEQPLYAGKSPKDPLIQARTLVRRGNFVGVASNRELLKYLNAVPADNPSDNERWLTSRALLAEVCDQTGNYGKVAKELPPSVVALVRKELRHSSLNPVSKFSDAERHLHRARVFFLLQFAIHCFRRSDFVKAISLMTECTGCLKAMSSDHNHFHGALSLLHYWQGRVDMARNRTKRALDHFSASMRETEENLYFHHIETSHDDERIAYAVYSLASCMAFGVAHLNHISGNLRQALELLRAASAMLMGAADNYRRGYAQMLVGAADRAIAGREREPLLAAIKTLKGAFDLFGINPTFEHKLHRARVRLQLALAYLYLAQTFEKNSGERKSYLELARDESLKAELVEQDFALIDFGDKELEYDLALLKSRIARESEDYHLAAIEALKARQIAETYPFAPPYSLAKALIASR